MERNDSSKFGIGSPKKHFREIILKSVHWSRRRCDLKGFFSIVLALEAILFSERNHF